ncbi:L,D-transpeptidase family protein [Pedobacter sp. KR3-3]|uniref:L,D-transpeptidase family protein n=1 Tax=Pedobacter albus TaxID=3113905 RepID=A0ABU7ICK0_9SPHI|nr:L,D-transpeptidase family protein [Pedobacter sp. KR3-3]MEE1947006.1 L,D-transpeptidase family protein [Pedobacter sp. KR3-3]
MKYSGVFLLLALMAGAWTWLLTKAPVTAQITHNEVPLWNDSLWKHLPKSIDTSIRVEDAQGGRLKFKQYIVLLFNQEAMIYQDNGQWKLQRFNESAMDSLRKDDYAVARSVRWEAYRNRNLSMAWSEKLNDIAHMLALGDHVLVLKSQRKLMVSRNGTKLLELPINLGWSPVGNKVSDGDGKTPEGVYHLDLKTERNDNLYKSIWISYPNAEDKLIAQKRGVKPGVGIMIHGTTPAKKNAKDWTAGCIALANKDIDSLFAHIGPGATIEIRK